VDRGQEDSLYTRNDDDDNDNKHHIDSIQNSYESDTIQRGIDLKIKQGGNTP